MKVLGILLYVLAVLFLAAGLSQLPKRIEADGWEGAMGLIAGQLLVFVVLVLLGALCRKKKPAKVDSRSQGAPPVKT